MDDKRKKNMDELCQRYLRAQICHAKLQHFTIHFRIPNGKYNELVTIFMKIPWHIEEFKLSNDFVVDA